MKKDIWKRLIIDSQENGPSHVKGRAIAFLYTHGYNILEYIYSEENWNSSIGKKN